jgi:hypothetical protein
VERHELLLAEEFTATLPDPVFRDRKQFSSQLFMRGSRIVLATV